MQIFSINTKGIFKPKRIIDINNYIIHDCKSSQGIEIKHKKNGRKLYLATKELFDFCMFEYEKQKPSIGVTYTYIKDEQGNKLRDEKGKLLRNYTSKEEVEEYKEFALKQSYISNDDFFYLVEEYRKETQWKN
jgi:hypothetical protein